MTTTNWTALSARRGSRIVALAIALAMITLFPAAPTFAHGDKTIAAGTSLRVRVETPIRSTTVNVGDPFRATVVAPVLVTGEEAIPAGTELVGRVGAVNRARAWGQPSGVTLQVDQLQSPTGETVNVTGELVDASGNPFTTVENLTRGTELSFRLARPLTVAERFYMGGGDEPGPDPGPGDDVFDTQATVSQAQAVLRDLGYFSGAPDGRLTQATRTAISMFQRDQRLPQTGFLDRATIERLGLISDTGREVTSVNVISADAMRHGAEGLHVRINAQTASAGWQVFEDHFRQRDTMHIYVRGIRSSGPGAQVLTNKQLDVMLTATEIQGVTRIVVHGTGRDVVITSNDIGDGSSALTPEQAAALEGQISRMLTDYARTLGVRYIPITGQVIMTRRNYAENEIELLFALNSLASSARLYTQIIRATNDAQALQGATDLFVAQANQVDRAITRTGSGRAAGVARAWATVRDDFEALDNGSEKNFNVNREGTGYRP